MTKATKEFQIFSIMKARVEDALNQGHDQMAIPVEALKIILDQLEVISKSEWKLAGELTELQINYNTLQKKDNSCTLGVGEGSGRLFVHGDYDSIKATQKIILERDALKAKLANPVVLSDCNFEAVSHMAHWYSEGECVAWVSGAQHVKKQIIAAGISVKEE